MIGLAERGVLGLARVLDAGERADVVDAPGLELEEDGGLARDHPVHDAAQVRAPLVVVGIRQQHHLLPRLPLLEAIGAGAHRMAVLGRLPQGPRLRERLQQVLGQDVGAPCLHRPRVGLVVVHVHRVRVGRVHALHEQEALLERGRRLRIDHRLVGEHHVLGGERVAVVPLDVPPQLEREVQAVLAVGPRLGHRRGHVEVLVQLHEAVVDQPAHLVGGLVRGEARDQPPDVPDGGLDEGVPVGGRAGAVLLGAALERPVAGGQQPQSGEAGQKHARARATARHGGPATSGARAWPGSPGRPATRARERWPA